MVTILIQPTRKVFSKSFGTLGKLFLKYTTIYVGVMFLGFIYYQYLSSHPRYCVGICIPEHYWRVYPIARNYTWWKFPRFLGDFLAGNWPQSIRISDGPTIELILSKIPITLEMLLYSITLSIVGGYSIGFYMARVKWNQKYQWKDGMLRFILGIFLYSPLIGILLQNYLSIKLGIFPSIGVNSPIFDDAVTLSGFKLIDSVLMGQFLQFLDVLWHLFLPLLTLTAYGISVTAKWVRKSFLDFFKSNFYDKSTGVYIKIDSRTSISKELKFPTILLCIQTVLPSLFFMGILVEFVFNLMGVGGLLLDAAYRWDGPVVIGIIHSISLLFFGINFCIELIQKKNGFKRKISSIYCNPSIIRAW